MQFSLAQRVVDIGLRRRCFRSKNDLGNFGLKFPTGSVFACDTYEMTGKVMGSGASPGVTNFPDADGIVVHGRRHVASARHSGADDPVRIALSKSTSITAGPPI